MTAPALTTAADVNALTGGGDTGTTAAIAAVSAMIRGYTRQTLTLVEDDEVVIYGTPGRRLLLGERPVVSITSPIVVDGRALADSECHWNRSGVLWRLAGWGYETTEVAVTYTHGYDPIPDDLAAVCQTASARLAGNPSALQSFSIIGDFSQTFGAIAEYAAFTVAEQTVLDRYRRRLWP